jgi:hypothetical protein
MSMRGGRRSSDDKKVVKRMNRNQNERKREKQLSLKRDNNDCDVRTFMKEIKSD